MAKISKTIILFIITVCTFSLLGNAKVQAQSDYKKIARCIWRGLDDELENQSCTTESSYDRFGKIISFRIEWHDGYKTELNYSARLNSLTTPSGITAHLSEWHFVSNLPYPQKIALKDLGVISIDYNQYPDSIGMDYSGNLAVLDHYNKYDIIPDNYDYIQYKLSPSIIRDLSSKYYDRVRNNLRLNNRVPMRQKFKLKSLDLNFAGIFPIRYISLIYDSPKSLEDALSDSKLLSPSLDYSKPDRIKNNKILYVGPPLWANIILNSCLLDYSNAHVSRVDCVFSSP